MTPIFAEIADKMPTVPECAVVNLAAVAFLLVAQFYIARFARWLRLLPALLASFWAYATSSEFLNDSVITEPIFHEMGSRYAGEIVLLCFIPVTVLALAMELERRWPTSKSAIANRQSAIP
jgi:hypothetical protein